MRSNGLLIKPNNENVGTNTYRLLATSSTQTCTKLADIQNDDIIESSENNSDNKFGDADNDFNKIFDDESWQPHQRQEKWLIFVITTNKLLI